VGISLSLDLLLSGSHGDETKDGGVYSLVDVVVCSLGHHLRATKEKISLLKKLWSHGISCTAIDISEVRPSDSISRIGFQGL